MDVELRRGIQIRRDNANTGPQVRILHAERPDAEIEEIQHDAELIAAELSKVLRPADKPFVKSIAIQLVKPELETSGAKLAVNADVAAIRGDNSYDLVVLHDCEKLLEADLALSMATSFVQFWFGDNAAASRTYIEGVAGLAVCGISAGPTLPDCDAWIEKEVKSGKKLSVAGSSVADGGPKGVNAIATCFLAFLRENSDPQSIHRYFESYDAARQDVAAYAAYNKPLAVLEEEWLRSIGRSRKATDAFVPFLKLIIPEIRPYKWKQIEILVYLILAAAFNVVQPYAIKIFIDRIGAELKSSTISSAGVMAAFVQHLIPFLIILAVIYILNGLVTLRRAYTVNWLNQNVLNSLQIRMYAHLQRLSHRFYNNARIADLMSRISDDLDNVQSALSQVTNKALYQVFTVVGALIALLMLTRKSPVLAGLIICIIPLFAANYVALRTRNKQASRDQRKRVSQAMTVLLQDLQAHALIKAFTMENPMLIEYKRRVAALQKSKLKLALLGALTDLSEDMTTALAQLVVFGVGGYLVLKSHGIAPSVGDLAAVLLLVKTIFSPIASLSGIGQTIQQATGSMERVSELLNEPVTIFDKPEAAILPELKADIRFENVVFGYDRPALNDLSLTIPACKHVAIVGPSGAGKSTIVSLLLRFWDVDSGQILYDGKDVRDVTLESLRSQIGLVFQETYILDTTLRANIVIGRPDATDEEVAAAAKAAQLDAFIETLPSGYDTVLGENGSKLSVGQKQRIAIARVFLKNPPILILDEATSALDASKEAGVLETLSVLAKGRTTISITHRIVQAASADYVFVINGGQLQQEGTHSELIAVPGLYADLYQQSSGANVLPAEPTSPVTDEHKSADIQEIRVAS